MVNHAFHISELAATVINKDFGVVDPIVSLHMYHCTQQLTQETVGDDFVLVYTHWDLKHPTKVFHESGDAGRIQQLFDTGASDHAGGSYPLQISDYFHNNELLDNDGNQVLLNCGWDRGPHFTFPGWPTTQQFHRGAGLPHPHASRLCCRSS